MDNELIASILEGVTRIRNFCASNSLNSFDHEQLSKIDEDVWNLVETIDMARG